MENDFNILIWKNNVKNIIWKLTDINKSIYISFAKQILKIFV